MWLMANIRWLSMMQSRSLKWAMTSSNSMASVRGVAHFRPTTLGIFASRSTMARETAALVQKVL